MQRAMVQDEHRYEPGWPDAGTLLGSLPGLLLGLPLIALASLQGLILGAALFHSPAGAWGGAALLGCLLALAWYRRQPGLDKQTRLRLDDTGLHAPDRSSSIRLTQIRALAVHPAHTLAILHQPLGPGPLQVARFTLQRLVAADFAETLEERARRRGAEVQRLDPELPFVASAHLSGPDTPPGTATLSHHADGASLRLHDRDYELHPGPGYQVLRELRDARDVLYLIWNLPGVPAAVFNPAGESVARVGLGGRIDLGAATHLHFDLSLPGLRQGPQPWLQVRAGRDGPAFSWPRPLDRLALLAAVLGLQAMLSGDLRPGLPGPRTAAETVPGTGG